MHESSEETAGNTTMKNNAYSSKENDIGAASAIVARALWHTFRGTPQVFGLFHVLLR